MEKEFKAMFVSMDIHELTDGQLAKLSMAIFEERERRSKTADLPPLSDNEKDMAHGRVIDAIKSYRVRTGCSLMEAKEAVDRYRDAHGIARW